MKITRIDTPFPAISIDDFFPSPAMLRAAAASFDFVHSEHWVKYGMGGIDDGQIQLCSTGRKNTPLEALLIMDYIATHFDPNETFDWITRDAFPDISHYGGGMMITPNSKHEGGYLGMHVDADIHKLSPNWKREYSAILCISEEYDASFDLLIHNGVDNHARIPYKFNRLNVFKCSGNSWHGFPEITKGLDRKTLGVMYWSIMSEEERKNARYKAKFNNNLEFV
jgi:hypothetical protein